MTLANAARCDRCRLNGRHTRLPEWLLFSDPTTPSHTGKRTLHTGNPATTDSSVRAHTDAPSRHPPITAFQPARSASGTGGLLRARAPGRSARPAGTRPRRPRWRRPGRVRRRCDRVGDPRGAPGRLRDGGAHGAARGRWRTSRRRWTGFATPTERGAGRHRGRRPSVTAARGAGPEGQPRPPPSLLAPGPSPLHHRGRLPPGEGRCGDVINAHVRVDDVTRLTSHDPPMGRFRRDP